MNSNVIMNMVKPYVKDGALTYDDFDGLFSILSKKEQYEVSEFLYTKGINLVDKQIDENAFVLDPEEMEIDDDEEFKILYDESIFKDHGTNNDYVVANNTNIRQTNELLCRLIQDGNKQAVQDLCVKNKKLVDKYVIAYLNWYNNKLEFEDLEQVGYAGMIKAAQKFDFKQGTSFSTYAVFWIKQAISREIMDNGYTIRIPVHMMERINKVGAIYNKLIIEDLDFNERVKLVSEKTGLSIESVQECLRLRRDYVSCASLNAPVGDDETGELIELIPIEDEVSIEEIVIGQALRESLEEVLQTLPKREREILTLRYGLADGKPRTLEEIGQAYNVTRERIRQIESKALKRLRHPSRSKKLRDYLNK